MVDLLIQFVSSFVLQAVGYLAVVGSVFLVVWRLGERRFARARIQARRRFNADQLKFELRNSLGTLVVGTLNAIGLVWLYDRQMTALTMDAAGWTWPAMVLSFAAIAFVSDTWFYWWHRLLHHPALYKYVHVVHHRSVDTNPFTSYSFHIVEPLLLGAWMIPMALLVPTYIPVLLVFQVFALAKNLEGHLGYEFMPRWFTRVPPFRWMTTATYHNLHHTKFNGNYGLYFRLWDRLAGTEVADYERTFATRGEGR